MAYHMRIDIQDIHKHYGPVRANNGISFSIAAGTIHGILGENGAGKSTLMKILAGFITKTSGAILVDHEAKTFDSPARASEIGIGMLYQDPMDFPRLSVLENFRLQTTGFASLDKKASLEKFSELSSHLGFELNPDSQVLHLTVGERQQLELIRLLGLGVKALILDEPTTGISESQKEILFQALKKLASDGRSVILVSHKLEDIDALCDKITVLRQGSVSGEMDHAPFDKNLLLKMMFGAPPPPPTRTAFEPGGIIFSMERVSAKGGRSGLKECTASIRQREIVGLAGLEGSGQGVFLRTAAALTRSVQGAVYLKKESLKGKDYHLLNRKGVAFLPAARLEEGLISGLTVAEHFALKVKTKKAFIPRQEALQRSQQRIREYQIKGTPELSVESLSGGNQQRLQLSLLPENPRLLLLENPTRGLDLESARWVWTELQNLCRNETGIFFTSSDLDEILLFSDRVLVFFEGRIIKSLQTAETDITELGRAVAGLI